MGRRSIARSLLALGLACSPVAAQDEPDEADEPLRTELVERARSRLVQVDVTVRGPRKAIESLTRDDFRIRLGFKKLREFELDRFCELPDAPEPAAEKRGKRGEPLAVPNATRPASFVFYLDQPHLTIEGRVRAIQTSRRLIDSLIRGGNRGMLVSNAARLSVIEPFTDDPAVLQDALDRLQDDMTQWDSYSEFELYRLEEIIVALNKDDDVRAAIARARIYQREERALAERNLRRLETVVARLAGVDSPKSLIYFADTMRQNAGEHYVSFFGDALITSDQYPSLMRMGSDSLTALLPFDRVVNEAAAQGVRVYAVQAEGMAQHMLTRGLSSVGASRSGTGGYTPRTRISDAQSTLASMAAETGGQSFLNGVRDEVIAETILGDMSCLYLLSFRPEGYRLDAPHRIVVEIDRPGIEARARGRFVLQSEQTRLTARLTSAFALPGSDDATRAISTLEVTGSLIPIGFDDGEYTALAQLHVPGVELPGATWELGASLVQGSRVREEIAGKIAIGDAGVPTVLEEEITFAPGEHELVSVAHEQRTNTVLSGHAVADWPDPGKQAFVSVTSLLQPAAGVFVRGDDVRSLGSLAIGEEYGLDVSRPAALVSVVCRARGKGGDWTVERRLHGSTTVEFPVVEFEDDERCTQIRDVISAGTLGRGGYRYGLRVLHDGETAATGERSFDAVRTVP